MQIIRRPETTTIILNMAFHLIKDQEEADRIKSLYENSDPKYEIIPIAKLIDQQTYQPLLAFVLYAKGSILDECIKYISPVEYISFLDEFTKPTQVAHTTFDPSKIKII